MTLVGGFYFGTVQNNNGWLIFGYIFGSIIGHLLAQMILEKTWRVFTKWRSYFYYVIGFSILIGLIMFDFTGYQHKIPDIEKIKSVDVVERNLNWYQEDKLETNQGITSKHIITNVQDLHQKLIDMSDRNTAGNYPNNTIEIRYQLENGRDLMRQYTVSDIAVLDDYLKPIYEDKEHKKANNEIFSIDNANIDRIEMDTFLHSNQIMQESQINEGIDALKQDILAETYIDIRYPTTYLTSMQIYFDSKRNPIYLPIQSNYTSFIDWLKDEGLYEDVMITQDDVRAIYVKSFENDTDDIYNTESYVNEESDTIKITNDNQVITLLSSIGASGYDPSDKIYGIAIDLKETDEMLNEILEPNRVPEFVLEALE